MFHNIPEDRKFLACTKKYEIYVKIFKSLHILRFFSFFKFKVWIFLKVVNSKS